MLTGESRPVRRGPGDRVIGGAINGEGALTVRVTATGQETYLAQVIELVRQAQESKSRTQDLANTAAFVLTVAAVTIGAITLAGWLVLGQELAFAVERAVTVMVISCPHALGLAVPLVVAVSTSLAAGAGLLIRDRQAFEAARDLDVVIFDKTGTLTEGRFGVTATVPLADLPEDAVLALAAALEAMSEHPIAQGIVDEARRRGLAVPAAENFRALPGRGVEGDVEGRRLRVVSPGALEEQGIAVDDDRLRAARTRGETVVYPRRGRPAPRRVRARGRGPARGPGGRDRAAVDGLPVHDADRRQPDRGRGRRGGPRARRLLRGGAAAREGARRSARCSGSPAWPWSGTA